MRIERESMSELVESELPGIELIESPLDDAPWGRKKDGTPKAKPGRTPGSGGGSPASKAKQDEIANEVSQKMLEVFLPIGIASPLAYCVLEDRSDRFAKALVRRSAKNPKLKAAIDTFLSGTDMVEIVMLPAGMIVAALVDYNRLSPESKPSKHFNIDQHYEEMYEEMVASQNGHVQVQPRTGFA